MERLSVLTQEEQRTAEGFRSLRCQALRALKTQVRSAEAPSKPKAVCLSVKNASVDFSTESLLGQLRTAREQASQAVAQAQQSQEASKDQIVHLESLYSQKNAEIHATESAARDFQAGRDVEKQKMMERMPIILDIYAQRSSLDGKINEYSAMARKAARKKSIELVFRPDLTFPLILQESDYKAWQKRSWELTQQLHDGCLAYKNDLSQWLSAEHAYRSAQTKLEELHRDRTELQSKLMDVSKQTAYWLEWFVLYGLFEIYIRSQEQSVEMLQLLEDLGETVSLFSTYSEVKEALQYWADRDAHPEYLKEMLKRLGSRRKDAIWQGH